MKHRWGALFGAALCSLIGISWLAARWGLGPSIWAHVQMIGMVVACGIAFVALRRDARDRRYAAAVLVAAGPMGWDIVKFLKDFVSLFEYFGLPGIMWFCGALVTIALAIWNLVVPIPPRPTDDPLAKARALR